MRRSRPILLLVATALLASAVAAPASAAPASPVTFTILHTNDFHGQLEAVGQQPGLGPRRRRSSNDVRTAVGATTSSSSTPATRCREACSRTSSRAPRPSRPTTRWSYAVATFGNHEFDWGQATLAARTSEADYPYVTANIVKNDTGNCATAGWTKPDFAGAPYSRGRRAERRQGRVHRRDDPGDADDHDRQRHRGPVLQGSGRVDPPLLRRDEGRVPTSSSCSATWATPTAATATGSRSTATRPWPRSSTRPASPPT